MPKKLKTITAVLPDVITGIMVESDMQKDIKRKLYMFIESLAKKDVMASFFYQPSTHGSYIIVSFHSYISVNDFEIAQRKLDKLVLKFTDKQGLYMSYVKNKLDVELNKKMVSHAKK